MPDGKIPSGPTPEMIDALSGPFPLLFALAVAMAIAMKLESSRSPLESRSRRKVRRWSSRGRELAGGTTAGWPRR